MKRWQKLVLATSGLVLFSSAVAMAANGSHTIEVFYRDIKLVVKGLPVKTSEEPFIYNGRTYVPLTTVAEALGEEVKWDDDTSTIFIGRVPGDVTFLSDLKPYFTSSRLQIRRNNEDVKWVEHTVVPGSPTEPMTMAGTKYQRGLMVGLTGAPCCEESGELKWNLNGQYTSLSGLLGLDDARNQSGVVVTFFGDGNKLAEYSVQPGDMPKQVDLNLKGILQLSVSMKGYPFRSWGDLVNMTLK